MSESSHALLIITLLLGGLIFLAILIKSELSRFGIHSLIGFMVIDFLLRIINDSCTLFTRCFDNLA